MSMQRVCNTGSFLQAYGLKSLIESFGHEVVFVDYHIGKPMMKTRADWVKYYSLLLRNILINVFTELRFLRFILPESFSNIVSKRDDYRHQFLPLLGIKEEKAYNTSVDVLVIGSDEVFNCTQLNPDVGFSPELFGDKANAKMIISYAASFGNTTLQKLDYYNKVNDLKVLLKNFSAISVRDTNSHLIIRELMGIEPEINMDPVLMYDFMSSVPNREQRENYIIVYAYRSRITTEEAETIKSFADEEGKRLISVSGEIDWCDEHFTGGPFEVLDLFRHADYAITDTFHGTIFSIINRIRFVSIIRKSTGGVYGNQEKLQDLLERLGLEERSYYFDSKDFDSLIRKKIDYDSVFEVINRERQHTRRYLETQFLQ